MKNTHDEPNVSRAESHHITRLCIGFTVIVLAEIVFAVGQLWAWHDQGSIPAGAIYPDSVLKAAAIAALPAVYSGYHFWRVKQHVAA